MKMYRACLWLLPTAGGLLFGGGCAFDVSHINEQPAQLNPSVSVMHPWTLVKSETLHVGSGYSTVLNAGTRWTPAGHISQGDVYRTRDQIVEVQSSNNYEAWVVRQGSAIVGFYLPVERSFTAATTPVTIETGAP